MMPRLRRSRCSEPGIARQRRGRGFSYSFEGRQVTDRATLQRIKDLVIPPAWQQVWICPDPQGHLQAVGTDAAGRRQYRYHDRWRTRRDAAKFAHMLDVAQALPDVRERIEADLGKRSFAADRVLAGAVRLLDTAVIRVGGEGYAVDDPKLGEATFGLATLRRDHVTVHGAKISLAFLGKGGTSHTITVTDRKLATLLRGLLDREDPDPELLAYAVDGAWVDVRSGDVNTYLRAASGIEFTAKDFRTWHGTVAAAVALAGTGPAHSKAAAKKNVAAAMRDVAELLGNTATVARKSYVDPRIIDAYTSGDTISWHADADVAQTFADRTLWAQAEKATLSLLT